MRVVLDTNILISGLFWKGPPAIVWQMATDGEFVILASDRLLAEYAEVLFRRKFARVFSAVHRTPDGVVSLLERLVEHVQPVHVPSHHVRDEKDRMVLACAVGGKADVIVSGDDDLIALHVYEGIPIMTAPHFLAWQRSERPAAP